MDLTLDAPRRRLLRDFRAWLDRQDLDDVVEEQRGIAETDIGPRGVGFVAAMGASGWLGVGFPERFGGRGGSPLDQWVLMEELAWRGLPHPRATIAVAHTLVSLQNTVIQPELVAGILAGRALLAMGYTEPDAGTDLGSLRTRAVRDGDAYVINGSKLYSTGAHFGTHMWTAVRTGTQEDRHRGLSVLVVPMDTPGITVVPMRTQAGKRTNEVFFDDVRVAATALVGEKNQGWAAMMDALNNERFRIHSAVLREYLAAVRMLRETAVPPLGLTGEGDLRLLGELAADVAVTRLFSVRGALALDRHEQTVRHASMAKVWTGRTRQSVPDRALDRMGPYGEALGTGGDGSPAAGITKYFLNSPFGRFAGGTEEIQLDLIAREHGLGRGVRSTVQAKETR